MAVKEDSKSALVRFDKPAIAERLAPRLQDLADAKGVSFSRMVLQAIRELLDRDAGGPDIVQIHRDQQSQKGLLDSITSMLGTLTTHVEHTNSRLTQLEKVVDSLNAAFQDDHDRLGSVGVSLFKHLEASSDWDDETRDRVYDAIGREREFSKITHSLFADLTASTANE